MVENMAPRVHDARSDDVNPHPWRSPTSESSEHGSLWTVVSPTLLSIILATNQSKLRLKQPIQFRQTLGQR